MIQKRHLLKSARRLSKLRLQPQLLKVRVLPKMRLPVMMVFPTNFGNRFGKPNKVKLLLSVLLWQFSCWYSYSKTGLYVTKNGMTVSAYASWHLPWFILVGMRKHNYRLSIRWPCSPQFWLSSTGNFSWWIRWCSSCGSLQQRPCCCGIGVRSAAGCVLSVHCRSWPIALLKNWA